MDQNMYIKTTYGSLKYLTILSMVIRQNPQKQQKTASIII